MHGALASMPSARPRPALGGTYEHVRLLCGQLWHSKPRQRTRFANTPPHALARLLPDLLRGPASSTRGLASSSHHTRLVIAALPCSKRSAVKEAVQSIRRTLLLSCMRLPDPHARRWPVLPHASDHP